MTRKKVILWIVIAMIEICSADPIFVELRNRTVLPDYVQKHVETMHPCKYQNHCVLQINGFNPMNADLRRYIDAHVK